LISAVPFRTPPTTAVVAVPWYLHNSEGVQVLPAALHHWDYNQHLHVGRSVQLDVPAIRRSCNLAVDASLHLVAVWSCPGTALRGKIDDVRILETAAATRVVLQGQISGSELSGALQIETMLVLTSAHASKIPLAPSRVGSILWRDTQTTILEGEAPRFPVETVDFAATMWAPPGAAWHLAWDPHDLRQPFLGAVRLMINSRSEPVVMAVSRNDSDPGSRAIRSTIHYEVGRALLRGALLNDEFRKDPAGFPDGTTGCVLWRLIRLLFPGDTPEGIKNLMDQNPDRFDSELQDKLQLFHV
jgi:hypothetical protein